MRLDHSAEVVEHANVCPVGARERAVLRIRDRVTYRVWPCIPNRSNTLQDSYQGCFQTHNSFKLIWLNWNPVKQMTTESCRFRDFAVPLLGLSTRHISMHEMHATQLVDSSSRTPYFPDAAGMPLCLRRMIFRLRNQLGS